MRQNRSTPLGATTFAIRVDSYEEGQMQGAIDGALFSGPTEFKSLPQLIIMLDELMDEGRLATRSALLDPMFIPTLELEIRFRQHHSWQGVIRRLDDAHELAFRSVLELIVTIELLLGS